MTSESRYQVISVNWDEKEPEWITAVIDGPEGERVIRESFYTRKDIRSGYEYVDVDATRRFLIRTYDELTKKEQFIRERHQQLQTLVGNC
jgi:hypothetical protein